MQSTFNGVPSPYQSHSCHTSVLRARPVHLQVKCRVIPFTVEIDVFLAILRSRGAPFSDNGRVILQNLRENDIHNLQMLAECWKDVDQEAFIPGRDTRRMIHQELRQIRLISATWIILTIRSKRLGTEIVSAQACSKGPIVYYGGGGGGGGRWFWLFFELKFQRGLFFCSHFFAGGANFNLKII